MVGEAQPGVAWGLAQVGRQAPGTPGPGLAENPRLVKGPVFKASERSDALNPHSSLKTLRPVLCLSLHNMYVTNDDVVTCTKTVTRTPVEQAWQPL